MNKSNNLEIATGYNRVDGSAPCCAIPIVIGTRLRYPLEQTNNNKSKLNNCIHLLLVVLKKNNPFDF